jgi:hypothetical protein
MLTGIYARFDAERVADRSARSGGQVLMMRTSENYSTEQKAEFSKALQALINTPTELRAACTELTRIGSPTYFPKYLILHGINAFSSPTPLENALNPAFDGEATWLRLMDTYARCPK